MASVARISCRYLLNIKADVEQAQDGTDKTASAAARKVRCQGKSGVRMFAVKFVCV